MVGRAGRVAWQRCASPNASPGAATQPAGAGRNRPSFTAPARPGAAKVDNKTVTRTLTAEQAERYRPWFDNARRLRELLTELETLSLQAADITDGRGPKPSADMRKARRKRQESQKSLRPTSSCD